MTEDSSSPTVTLDPDATEEELGSAIDNIIASRAYNETRVVGLGGSAGGIPALQRFFAAMPESPGMAFVVILHLSPEHESVLSEVLQRSTKMPVQLATDGEQVALNHVYVIPPGKHLTMVDGRLHLTELPRDRTRRMTVDLFFRSPADSHGPHSVAIVLSGGDGDREGTAQLDGTNRELRREVSDHLAAERNRQTLQQRLITAQEQERSRISRELHDEVGQQVSALLLALQGLESTGSREQLSAKVRELRAAVEDVGRELHQLAYQLRPIALDELGLARALNGLAENWTERTGLNIQVVTSGIDTARLPADIETTIYRIVQEAMNNVHKHAAAKNVSIIVELRRNEVLAIVEDDGVGVDVDVDVDAASAPDSGNRLPPKIGISGMRERAALVGGQLTLESTPGAGTTVRVRIPLRSKSRG